MIDFHCHLLYGVDDGPEEIDESVEMAFALQRAGFTAVYCTPHLMKGVHDTEHQKCMDVLETLRQKLIEEKIALQLYLGREYYLDEFIFEHLKNPLPLEETKYILLEIPDNIPYKFVKQACFEIRRHGFIPMIAHPERGRLFELLEQNERKETNRLNPDKKHTIWN